jgi:hypothetical protein
MSNPRIYWTLGTRDFKLFATPEFLSADCAVKYRDDERMDGWLLVAVAVAPNDTRSYWSPEQPAGPAMMPTPGGF